MTEVSTNVVRFFKHWEQNNFQSEKQGRPVGEQLDYVEIRATGSKLNVLQRQATPKDKSDYPREWDLYQRGLEQVADGTPLCEWEVMTESTVAMLKALNIHTIEALVALSDAGLQQIGIGARQLQSGAKLFLEQAPSRATSTLAESADLQVENEALQTRVGQLEAENAELRAVQDSRVGRLETKLAEIVAAREAKPTKRSPGRSSKKAA